ELVNHDPLHSLVLNCKMYWGNYSGSWSYEEGLNGFSQGIPGILEATAAVAAAPFYIQLGLVAKDHGGNLANVPYDVIMSEAQSKGIGYLFWRWNEGSSHPNNLVNNQLDVSTRTPLGTHV